MISYCCRSQPLCFCRAAQPQSLRTERVSASVGPEDDFTADVCLTRTRHVVISPDALLKFYALSIYAVRESKTLSVVTPIVSSSKTI